MISNFVVVDLEHHRAELVGEFGFLKPSTGISYLIYVDKNVAGMGALRQIDELNDNAHMHLPGLRKRRVP